MDALMLLKQDHQTVEELFQRFEQSSERALKSKKQLADRIVRELAIHSAIEEQLFYPAIRAQDEELNRMVLKSLEEHHIVKWTLNELEKTGIEDERFLAKVLVLIENVREHVKEEERKLFPLVKRAMSRDDLEVLGENLAELKKIVPTHPHPRAPDQPPGNLVAGMLAKVVDTGRDMLSGRVVRRPQASAKQRRLRRR